MTKDEASLRIRKHWMNQDYTVRDRNSDSEKLVLALEALGLVKFDPAREIDHLQDVAIEPSNDDTIPIIKMPDGED
jgi:tricorn protease-like protein